MYLDTFREVHGAWSIEGKSANQEVVVLNLNYSSFSQVALHDLVSRGLSTDLLVLTNKATYFPICQTAITLVFCCDCSPIIKPPFIISLKKRHFPWNSSIPYLFLPSSIEAASLSTLSVPVSIWELIFHTTEQQRQLSCVVCWSEAMKKKSSL